MTPATHNERVKLRASALNNLGVAAIVTGGYGTVIGYMFGSVQDDDPLRIVSIVVVWLSLGFGLIQTAQRVMKGMV